MKTLEEIKSIINKISYKKGWGIIMKMDGDRPYIQAQFMGEDAFYFF
jgi:hypothetical protein